MTTTQFHIQNKSVTSPNGKINTYKVANGTHYRKDTHNAVIEALETARMNDSRIRLYYGDVETGKCWNEEFDIMGTIGRSCGPLKVPLLIPNVNSDGGTEIMVDRVIKVVETATKHTLYEHPKFHVGQVKLQPADTYALKHGYPHSVAVDGVVQANFKTEREAQRYMDFIKGLRNSK